MQQSIVKFIALSYRHCSTCFGYYHAHHQEPVKLPLKPPVSVWMWRWKCSQPWLRTLPPPHSYGNQRLQRQFDGLLTMGMVMPETCWAVSVRQSNKFYDWLLHLVGCFYLNDWRCTEPQTLKPTVPEFLNVSNMFNPLNAELNPICYLLALLGAHHILHVSRIRVKQVV